MNSNEILSKSGSNNPSVNPVQHEIIANELTDCLDKLDSAKEQVPLEGKFKIYIINI